VAALAFAVVITPFPALLGSRSAAWTAIAADPTADPSVDPSASLDPTPTLDPQATALPSPTPDPGPSPEPTPGATPSDAHAAVTPSPEPTATPVPATAGPADSPAAMPTAEPGPTATPSAEPSASPAPVTIIYKLSLGQQSGKLVGDAIPIYRLVLSGIDPEANSPHGASSLTGTDCAACHKAHSAQEADLLEAAAPLANVCLACHAPGLGARDEKTVFQDAAANQPSTDAYFSHPLDGLSAGSTGITCADCHDPHLSGTAKPAQTTTGWTAGGAIATARGVAVTNGATGSKPAYTAIDHGLLTYEYQLCLACHSGAATLPGRDSDHPSWWALDKGIELNPANASYHPIEAAGRNVSAQMAASLTGTSPFKAWTYDLDSTIRCTSCHGNPATVNQAGSTTPKTPSPDALEASHASPNRGLLIAPYKDRTLKPAGEAYQAEDFALCYLCHAERPFADPNVDPSAPDTAFPLHGAHLTSIAGPGGASLSIDAPGAGQGLATCSECHFRSHSTAIAYQPGDTAPVARATGASGLVNFAPNVVGLNGAAPIWSQPGALGQGSCALTCHGYTHSAVDPLTQDYTVAPATGFTAAPTNGSAGVEGLTVQFTDATRYASAATAVWAWEFGDGSTATAQSPSHVYAAAGTYTVSLTVTRNGDGLTTTLTRTAYITVAP
jgi:predicted CXXCH cytochrome family protein